MKYPATKCAVLDQDDWSRFKRQHRADVLAAAGTMEEADEAMASGGLVLKVGTIGVHVHRSRPFGKK
jgi:hypothetical protein